MLLQRQLASTSRCSSNCSHSSSSSSSSGRARVQQLTCGTTATSGSGSSSGGSAARQACICHAGRRSRKTTAADAAQAPGPPPEADAPPKRRGGRRSSTAASPAPPPTQAQAPLQESLQQQPEAHERVISYEMDLTSSMELDYTDNAALVVPSYTHQAQGHESATQPPLDNYVPDYGGSGLLGNEELPAWQDLRQQQQPAATAAGAAGGWGAPPPMQQQQQQATTFAQVQQQQQGLGSGLPPLQGGPGAQVMVAQQVVMGADGEAHLARAGGAGAGVGAAGDDDDDEEGDDLLGAEEPPGLFDYDAGLAFAEVEALPARPLTHLPERARPRSRAEADYMLRYLTWVGTMERERKEEQYGEAALAFHMRQRVESENVYITGKALSVVMAEIEQEDAATGNRVDTFYPTWARAEHRWYPSGRFAAYNEYVKANLPDLTVKFAPGADQAEEFDIMDDVLLMTNDPSSAGKDNADDGDALAAAGPASGLSLDSFMAPGLLPGAAASELGQSLVDDVLGLTTADELAADEEE